MNLNNTLTSSLIVLSLNFLLSPFGAMADDVPSAAKSISVYDDPSTADIRKAREDSFAQTTESAKKKTLAVILNTCKSRLEKEPNNIALLVWYSASLEQMAGYVSSPKQSAKLCEQAIDLAEQAIKLDPKCEMVYTQKAAAMVRLVNLQRRYKGITKEYVSYEQALSLMRTAIELDPTRPRLAAIFSTVVHSVIVNDFLNSITTENKLSLLQDAIDRLSQVPSSYKYYCDVKRRAIPLLIQQSELLGAEKKAEQQLAKIDQAMTLGQEMLNETGSCGKFDRGMTLKQLATCYVTKGKFYAVAKKPQEEKKCFETAIDLCHQALKIDSRDAGAKSLLSFAEEKLAGSDEGI